MKQMSFIEIDLLSKAMIFKKGPDFGRIKKHVPRFSGISDVIVVLLFSAKSSSVLVGTGSATP